MNEKALGTKEIYPSDDILRNTMGKSYAAYSSMLKVLLEYNINPEWTYYNDTKCWLCKLILKKKNLAWLSADNGAFNVTCYFLERHLEDVKNSDISEDIKEKFYQAKTCGKIIPMPLHNDSEKLNDNILKMILLKKGLK